MELNVAESVKPTHLNEKEVDPELGPAEIADTKAYVAPRVNGEESPKHTHEDDDDENLGENFDDTPWVPPTIEKAWEYRLKSIYRVNNPIWSIKVTKAADLGTGMQLYFQFIKTIGILLFFCFLASIPSICFCYYGHRTSNSNRDFFGLYQVFLISSCHFLSVHIYSSSFYYSLCLEILDMILRQILICKTLRAGAIFF
jgi:hypothetical protein